MNDFLEKRISSLPDPAHDVDTSSVETSTIPNSTMEAIARGTQAPTSAMLGRRENLAPSLQTKMQGAFGADFSNVEIYRSETARAAGFNGIASGNKVALSPDIDLNSHRGQSVLGHEFSHVVAQTQGIGGGRGFLGNASLERQADVQGERAASGMRAVAGSGLSMETSLDFSSPTMTAGGMESAALTPISATAGAFGMGAPMQGDKNKGDGETSQAAPINAAAPAAPAAAPEPAQAAPAVQESAPPPPPPEPVQAPEPEPEQAAVPEPEPEPEPVAAPEPEPAPSAGLGSMEEIRAASKKLGVNSEKEDQMLEHEPHGKIKSGIELAAANSQKYKDALMGGSYNEDFKGAMESEAAKFFSGLSNEEFVSAADYTTSDYELLNGFLRDPKSTDDPHIAERTEHLKGALGKYENPGPLKLYRWVSKDAIKSMLKSADNYDGPDNLVGKVLYDPAFMSTSLNNFSYAGECLLEIHVPAKARAGAPIMQFSRFAEEEEYLLNAGSKLVVRSKGSAAGNATKLICDLKMPNESGSER